ncbi:MAG: hypothetical protein RL065_57 [Bacteroidota bacterium]|jgi:hypothetical protein
MYKEHLTKSLLKETSSLKKLAALIEEKDLEYRQAEKIRSTLELMQYLSSIGSVMLRWLIKNDITPEDWAAIRAHRTTLTIENFKERIEQQEKEILDWMNSITDEDLINKIALMPTKEEMPLGAAIINAPIKWLTTYRMQLFFNLKANGRPELGTKDAWSV